MLLEVTIDSKGNKDSQYLTLPSWLAGIIFVCLMLFIRQEKSSSLKVLVLFSCVTLACILLSFYVGTHIDSYLGPISLATGFLIGTVGSLATLFFFTKKETMKGLGLIIGMITCGCASSLGGWIGALPEKSGIVDWILLILGMLFVLFIIKMITLKRRMGLGNITSVPT